jgi:hypothetical protein
VVADDDSAVIVRRMLGSTSGAAPLLASNEQTASNRARIVGRPIGPTIKGRGLDVDNDKQQLPVHRKQGLWPG